MRHSRHFQFADARRFTKRVLVLLAAVSLTACQSWLNDVRVTRFSSSTPPARTVEPRALALALQVSKEDNALTAESVRAANALLQSQGRLQAQTLSITPFTDAGERVAKRVASALQRSGAQAPAVLARPQDVQRQAEAARNGWDLELQSEALVASSERCTIAQPGTWMVNPYQGIGPLGCANRNNIARMVSDPRDLMRPRVLEAANGAAAAQAVERYQAGELRDLIDIDFEN